MRYLASPNRHPKRFLALFVLSVLVVFAQNPARAESPQGTTIDTARFTLYFGDKAKDTSTPEINISNIAQRSISILNGTYEEYSRIFQTEPKRKVVLRFLYPKDFQKQTGAPSWTSAMYFRDEITIPLTSKTGVQVNDLRRALRHEYVHAVIAEISKYRCPAWLDEGVAQLLEGPPNPLLGPALRKWVKVNPAIPLDWLQNGFTTLDRSIVPAAYAESLFATRKLIHELGFSSIIKYLNILREGRPEKEAFEKAFNRTQTAFVDELTVQMRRWAHSGQEHP